MKKRTILFFLILSLPVFSQVEGFSEKRHTVGLGYQVGGQTLIGVDYNHRFNDLLGVHIGGGLSGYAGGINIYFSPEDTSSFVSLNYEDGGFGLWTLATVKWNKMFGFGHKREQGIFFSVGGGKTLAIDPDFEELLYGNQSIDYTLVLAVGYGFRL